MDRPHIADDDLLYDAETDLERMRDEFARMMVRRPDGWEIAQAHRHIKSALTWLDRRRRAYHPTPTTQETR